MPKLGKRALHLKNARKVKGSKLEPENAPDQLEEVEDEPDVEPSQASQLPSDSDSDFDFEEALKMIPLQC